MKERRKANRDTSHRTVITLVHEDTLMKNEKELIITQLEWLCNAQLIKLVEDITIDTQ